MIKIILLAAWCLLPAADPSKMVGQQEEDLYSALKLISS